MTPKLPAPCDGIKPQPDPTWAAADGVGRDPGTGGAPVGEAGEGGDVPQPTAVSVSSAAIKATPKEAWERMTSLPVRLYLGELPRNPTNLMKK
jgi:hypothetical protein